MKTMQHRVFLALQRAQYPMTIDNVAQQLNVPYDSAKRAVRALSDKGLAIPMTARRRGQVWAVSRDAAPPCDLRGRVEGCLAALCFARARRMGGVA